ncbi:hypothetical protein BU17DRAFT_98018 [Hysterangium stoloniferum]|nr:hypothetical protein BU17DRAFT_98018 [Hysterangium stoloniferum]
MSVSPTSHRKPSRLARADGCEPAEPANTVTDRLNGLLSSGGDGYVLSLCPNQNYNITGPLLFNSPNQEISTQGLPRDNSRAMLTVSGPLHPGQEDSHTTAVWGQCQTCDGVKLRNIQINGARNGGEKVNGGANIEMGGSNSGQLIEFVRSFDPRSWSCLHLFEGSLDCASTTVQNNDIGPCGSDAPGQWADGISVACANTIVRDNLINTPTDGGVVLFGSPGSLVENNTIWVETTTLLGGINLVDVQPWGGDYTGTIVRNNHILGGFATDTPSGDGDTKGVNSGSAIIKIGIAMGPRVWFGDYFQNNISHGAVVTGNQFEGAFAYAMAISTASNFTVQDNVLVGNDTAFIGTIASDCSNPDTRTAPGPPFVVEQSRVTDSNLQSDFVNIVVGDNLLCIRPPTGGELWPFKSTVDGIPATPATLVSSPRHWECNVTDAT